MRSARAAWPCIAVLIGAGVLHASGVQSQRSEASPDPSVSRILDAAIEQAVTLMASQGEEGVKPVSARAERELRELKPGVPAELLVQVILYQQRHARDRDYVGLIAVTFGVLEGLAKDVECLSLLGSVITRMGLDRSPLDNALIEWVNEMFRRDPSACLDATRTILRRDEAVLVHGRGEFPEQLAWYLLHALGRESFPVFAEVLIEDEKERAALIEHGARVAEAVRGQHPDQVLGSEVFESLDTLDARDEWWIRRFVVGAKRQNGRLTRARE